MRPTETKEYNTRRTQENKNITIKYHHEITVQEELKITMLKFQESNISNR